MSATSLEALEAIFARWLPDDDPLPTRAVLAAYLANRNLQGDPVWLMLVGGSGVGKTERLTPLSGRPDVILESAISGPAAFLSGTSKKDRAKDATGGILRKLPDSGGVLVLKDFTSVLEMHREARAEVLAALREIYDGRWDRSVGADGGRTLTWSGRLGLIAGCTTAIDSAHAVMAAMGTRFVIVRLKSDARVAFNVLAHVGLERGMRDELRKVVHAFLAQPPGAAHALDGARDRLVSLSSYVALARSPVDRDLQGEIRLVLDPEAPTRIVAMLAMLWRAAGLLGLDEAAAWTLVRRIAVDSIPKLRACILDVLTRATTPLTTGAIADAVEHPARTTRRALEDLVAHHVVRRATGGTGKADLWELAAQTRKWLAEIETGPSLSDDTLSKNQRSIDDKTGKVARSPISEQEMLARRAVLSRDGRQRHGG